MTSFGRDAPYPEPKATHTMARTGRPFTDRKPPPAAPIWDVIEGFGRFHVLASAIELGVFDALEAAGAVSVDELAVRVGASPRHLHALLQALAGMGFLERRGERYELNDTSRRYLTSFGPATMAALVAVAPGPLDNWATLTETVRRGRPARPIEDDPVAFYGPLVRGTFATILRCAQRADRQLSYSTLPDARVLDLAAGLAPWSIAVLTSNPAATAVVNDWPEILDAAEPLLADHRITDRVELRPGNVHQITLERDHYDLAVLGHVCRTEPDQLGRELVGRATAALRPGGRLLLSDYFLGREVELDPHTAMMNVTMAASTREGRCRTADEYASWMRAAGLQDIRLIEPIGFQRVLVGRRPFREGRQ